MLCSQQKVRASLSSSSHSIHSPGDSAAGEHSATAGAASSAATLPLQPEKLNHPFGSQTLLTLLKAGARPNARDARGRSPLHILAEPEQRRSMGVLELTDGVAVLVSFDALFEDSPALQGLKRRMLGVKIDALVDALNLT